jgi:hypothetical protein
VTQPHGMAYKLRFHELAWAEWQKLDGLTEIVH